MFQGFILTCRSSLPTDANPCRRTKWRSVPSTKTFTTKHQSMHRLVETCNVPVENEASWPKSDVAVGASHGHLLRWSLDPSTCRLPSTFY